MMFAIAAERDLSRKERKTQGIERGVGVRDADCVFVSVRI